jgi:hypothetical protein
MELGVGWTSEGIVARVHLRFLHRPQTLTICRWLRCLILCPRSEHTEHKHTHTHLQSCGTHTYAYHACCMCVPGRACNDACVQWCWMCDPRATLMLAVSVCSAACASRWPDHTMSPCTHDVKKLDVHNGVPLVLHHCDTVVGILLDRCHVS